MGGLVNFLIKGLLISFPSLLNRHLDFQELGDESICLFNFILYCLHYCLLKPTTVLLVNVVFATFPMIKLAKFS